MAWPHKILTQMETVSAQHVDDEERFDKIQVADQNSFLERLSVLEVRFAQLPQSQKITEHYNEIFFVHFQMVVAGFSGYTNLERAHEVANEVRRVGKQLKECQEMAQLYNNRERLFGKPLTNVG